MDVYERESLDPRNLDQRRENHEALKEFYNLWCTTWARHPCLIIRGSPPLFPLLIRPRVHWSNLDDKVTVRIIGEPLFKLGLAIWIAVIVCGHVGAAVVTVTLFS